MTTPPLTLGGSGAATAVRLGGHRLSYQDLADRVAAAAADWPDLPPGADRDLTGHGVVDTLVAVFAAAAIGRSVRIADPTAPGRPAAEPGSSPVRAGSDRSVGEHPAEHPAERRPGHPAGPPSVHWLTVVTSGSSGHPRPVRRTAASWTSSFAPLTRIIDATPGDRVLLTGPLHATLHLFAAVHTLALGAELTDDPARATLLHAVPPVLADVLDDPRAVHLRTAVVAGAALPPPLVEVAARRGVGVVEYYGAAELSFVAAGRRSVPTAPHSRPMSGSVAGSSTGGLEPFPGVDLDVRDGEIWVRSPYLSDGYPPGVSGPYRVAPDGFATVGDRGALDAAGLLHVHGRGTSAITVGGATVLAEDIESALLPIVTDLTRGRTAAIPVAVVGAPAGRLAEVAVAVLPADPPVDGRALRAAARSALTGASLPRRWLVADQLPRTPGGKLARAALREAVRQYLAGDPTAPQAPGLRPLR